MEKTPIKITLPDGAVKDGKAYETTPLDVAKDISQGLANAVVAAKVDGKVWDLTRRLEGDCNLALLKFDDKDGLDTYWHSSGKFEITIYCDLDFYFSPHFGRMYGKIFRWCALLWSSNRRRFLL